MHSVSILTRLLLISYVPPRAGRSLPASHSDNCRLCQICQHSEEKFTYLAKTFFFPAHKSRLYFAVKQQGSPPADGESVSLVHYRQRARPASASLLPATLKWSQ